MFTPNILNITIWVVAGIMALIAIILIILRLLKIDIFKNSELGRKKDVGRVSKDMQQIVLSLGSVHELNLGYNILIKNKYSKTGFGLIPAIVVFNGKVYMLSNRIKVGKNNITFNSDKNVMIQKKNGKEVQDESFKYKWYKDTVKYLKTISNDMEIELIVPVVGDMNKINNKSGLRLIDSSELGDFIENQKGEQNLIIEKQFLEKLERDNIFKKAGSLDAKRTRKLMK